MAIERQIERLLVCRKTGHQSFLIAIDEMKVLMDALNASLCVAICYSVIVSVVRQRE